MIGGDGLIGRNLCAGLEVRGHEVLRTSRRGNGIHYDMLKPGPLPQADVGYIVAAVIRADLDPDEAWRVNVDGALATAGTMMEHGTFPVFISSRAVERRTDAYARTKAQVEASLWGRAVAVVRVGEFKDNLQRVIDLLVSVGEARKPGLSTIGGLS